MSLVKRICILADNSQYETNLKSKQVKFKNDPLYESVSHNFNPIKAYKSMNRNEKPIIKYSENLHIDKTSNLHSHRHALEPSIVQNLNTMSSYNEKPQFKAQKQT